MNLYSLDNGLSFWYGLDLKKSGLGLWAWRLGFGLGLKMADVRFFFFFLTKTYKRHITTINTNNIIICTNKDMRYTNYNHHIVKFTYI